MFQERRSYKRIPVQLKARVRIIIPEETFTPFSHEGTILDMGPRGIKLKTWDIDDATYKMLLTSTRQVRITFTPPNSQLAHTFFGKIVWIDFNNTANPPITIYGVYLEKPTEEDIKVIELCLKTYQDETPRRTLDNSPQANVP